MQEEWKDLYWEQDGQVYDYRGLYRVSNLGRVFGVKTNKMKRPKADRYGYLTVSLWKDNKEKNCKVHRLVAFMFIDGYFEGASVNHKDENKQNNCVDNLEWCTVEYNNAYGSRNDACKKKIAMYTLEGEYVTTFNSLREAADYLGIPGCGNLSSHLKGRQKTVKNHIFKYVEEE